jgi:hypothetical protein
MPTTATPNILTDPGYLFWAPLGTALPTNTVAGSKFTDAWAAAWISLGATEEGSSLSYEIEVEAVSVAEFFDPIAYRTTERTGNFSFALADYTIDNVKRAFNGGTKTLTGTGATQMAEYSPPEPGTEIRAMLGWESLDNTLRLICYQTINSGGVETEFKKAPDLALLPCEFVMEKPASQPPFKIFAAGVARGGA